MDKTIEIATFTRINRVSRETITSLKKYEEMLKKFNKNLNLVGESTINQIWHRHFLDSAQVIDFITKNDKNLIDLGSGAGFPGLVLAILSKDRQIPMKITLIEKSALKASFLNEVINNLELNVEVQHLNILDQPNKLKSDLFTARAFKPLKIILQFIDKKAEDWRKIFLFLGKTGRNELLQASKNWDIKYKQRMSITSSDSIVIEINKLKKK